MSRPSTGSLSRSEPRTPAPEGEPVLGGAGVALLSGTVVPSAERFRVARLLQQIAVIVLMALAIAGLVYTWWITHPCLRRLGPRRRRTRSGSRSESESRPREHGPGADVVLGTRTNSGRVSSSERKASSPAEAKPRPHAAFPLPPRRVRRLRKSVGMVARRARSRGDRAPPRDSAPPSAQIVTSRPGRYAGSCIARGTSISTPLATPLRRAETRAPRPLCPGERYPARSRSWLP